MRFRRGLAFGISIRFQSIQTVPVKPFPNAKPLHAKSPVSSDITHVLQLHERCSFPELPLFILEAGPVTLATTTVVNVEMRVYTPSRKTGRRALFILRLATPATTQLGAMPIE
jgi:hypothetical protein